MNRPAAAPQNVDSSKGPKVIFKVRSTGTLTHCSGATHLKCWMLPECYRRCAALPLVGSAWLFTYYRDLATSN